MTQRPLTATLERRSRHDRPQPSPRPVVVTRSETAECTCPEHCERDHEVD